jgi:DNA modification methylase
MNCFNQEITEKYSLWNMDCVDAAKALPDNSIDFSIYSPPFESLYVFSNSERDMGNSTSSETFWTHYRYLIAEMYRAMKPGRLVAVHAMNLPTSKTRDGYIGIKDFRGEIIRAHQDAGFYYASEVCIWKDPVVAMQRTKALGLLYKQLRKDSTMSRQGIADYLVVMRKPGENPEPVTHTNESFTVDEWQQYASPIWNYGENDPPLKQFFDWIKGYFRKPESLPVWERYADPVWLDIQQSKTLQYMSARDNDDERHISPLQLQVIERAINLWTNPNDLVFTPFLGIGSEAFVALQMGRRACGSELKKSYFALAARNCREAMNAKQDDLFANAS